MALLAVDIGNTHTVCGLFSTTGKLEAQFRMQTDRNACADELFIFINHTLSRHKLLVEDVDSLILATVVPELENEWQAMCSAENLRYMSANAHAPWSFRIELPDPSQLGPDRMANAEGALRFGSPLVVVDAGTATTFDVVDKDDNGFYYCGGAITPGVGLSLRALVSGASRLHAVSLLRDLDDSLAVVGNDTESAMKSGSVHGFATMVDGMVTKIGKERGWSEKFPVIATGGYADILRSICQSVTHYEPSLTLEGLYAIAKR